MSVKIDSNATGASIAEESALMTLPGTPVWYPLEPNSYKDLGAVLKTIARNPINPSRQRRKGGVVDIDAAGGINQDLTMTNLARTLQGFFFANWREQPTTQTMNAVAVAVTSTTVAKYNMVTPPAMVVGALLLATGFASTANNGVKHVASVNSGDVTVTEVLVVEASPPAAAKIQQVGFQGASGDLTLNLTGSVLQLRSTVLDFTTLGLLPGQWIYVGGDAAGTQFTVSSSTGLARIGVGGVAAHALTLDKADWATPATDPGTAKTIQIFIPNILRNEPLPADIIARSYQIERTLGLDAVGTMSQYLTGAVANGLSLNIAQASKVTVDIDWIACNEEQRTGTQAPKSGTRPTLAVENLINTSSDVRRMNLSLVSTNAAVSPLFAYVTDVAATIANNVSPNKAIGTLGAFSTTTGEFDVDGKLTAYFSDITAVQAVRNNADVTLDIFMVKDNQGHVWDMPLVGLGDGLLKVEANKPVTLPLTAGAAQSPFGYTLSLMYFPYLPTIASTL